MYGVSEQFTSTIFIEKGDPDSSNEAVIKEYFIE